MKFNLIVCTYKRQHALKALLDSVKVQTMYPDEILIIDGSPDSETAEMIKLGNYKNLEYYKVDEQNIGLTKQRNYGIQKASKDIDVICFLDDDIILFENYFEKLIEGYKVRPDALGIGGYIMNDTRWTKSENQPEKDEYSYDGWIRKLGSRNFLRKKIGLLSDEAPGIMPEYSHGLSISFLPPSEKNYPVEFFMGGVSSYRKEIFKTLNFSKYFVGYGLYEDMDFCLRLSKRGQLYISTGAKVLHNHDDAGRPNKFSYGKMVIRNGWYVWRLKYPKPGFSARFKWYLISLLLILVRIGNVLNSDRKLESFTEVLGRIFGLGTLLYNKPEHNE